MLVTLILTTLVVSNNSWVLDLETSIIVRRFWVFTLAAPCISFIQLHCQGIWWLAGYMCGWWTYCSSLWAGSSRPIFWWYLDIFLIFSSWFLCDCWILRYLYLVSMPATVCDPLVNIYFPVAQLDNIKAPFYFRNSFLHILCSKHDALSRETKHFLFITLWQKTAFSLD